jgi:DNA-binding transcriptional regulator YiaG
VRVRAAPPAGSSSGGGRVDLILTPAAQPPSDAFEVARLLVRAGTSVRTARKAVDDLAAGKTAYVEAPSVTDYALLKRKMQGLNVAVGRIALRAVDVKALRVRLGISQEAFAGRYGLDVATVRNWEQGRTTPEGPAAVLLQVIERDPEKVVELLVE